MAEVIWLEPVAEVLRSLPFEQRREVLRKTRLLRRFPRLYPAIGKGRFRRHRRVVVGEWLVYYRVVGNTAYVRGALAGAHSMIRLPARTTSCTQPRGKVDCALA